MVSEWLVSQPKRTWTLPGKTSVVMTPKKRVMAEAMRKRRAATTPRTGRVARLSGGHLTKRARASRARGITMPTPARMRQGQPVMYWSSRKIGEGMDGSRVVLETRLLEFPWQEQQ